MEDGRKKYKTELAKEISGATELLEDLTRIKAVFAELNCLTEEWLTARHRESKEITGKENNELDELFSGPLMECWGLSREIFETFSQVMLFYEFLK